jgi:hypothetical protein
MIDPPRYVKASNMGTKILNESQFEEFVRKKSNNPNFTLSIRKAQGFEASTSSEKTPAKQQLASKSAGNSQDNQMWTEIYAPKDMGDLVGNNGVVDQLYEWLRDWDDVNIRGNKKQV